MKKQIKQILFTKPYLAQLVDNGTVDLNNLKDDEVAFQTMVTTISAGTEKANYTGEKRVAGNTDYITPFPRTAGYSNASVVIGVGKEVKNLKIGDAVVVSGFSGHHKTYGVCKEKALIKIPDGVSLEDASISYIATFPLGALRKVELELGESCLITGLGILGTIAVKLARAMGAYPIVCLDPIKERREKALEYGADYAFDPLDEKAIEKVKEVTGGGAKTAIEVTGIGAGLTITLDCMKPLGRVALLGCTRNSDFTIDYYRKVHSPGITLIGAHTNARPKEESYPHYFTQNDEILAILNMIKGKRIVLKDIIIETHNPKDCQTVYDRLINDKKFPIGVQFDWRNL